MKNLNSALRAAGIVAASVALSLSLAGCGGGKDKNDKAPQSLVKGQVVALGSVQSRAAVHVYNANGGACADATADTSGVFTVNVTGCTLPALIIANNTSNAPVAATVLTVGYPGLAAGSTAQANMTAITTAIVDMLLGNPPVNLSQYPVLFATKSSSIKWATQQQAAAALQQTLAAAVPGYVAADPFTGGLTGAAGAQALALRVAADTTGGIKLQYQASGMPAVDISVPPLSNAAPVNSDPSAITVGTLYGGQSLIFNGTAIVTSSTTSTTSNTTTPSTTSINVNCTGQVSLAGDVSGSCSIGSSQGSMTGSLLNKDMPPSSSVPAMQIAVSSATYGTLNATLTPQSGNFAQLNAPYQSSPGSLYGSMFINK
jgi:hypothetical protein